ncbi:hypothetical protein [Microbispora sp. H10949]|uniref:hypothetical protein n=1 Tax=Microbispora sp. H10949 TaxID=2729111 RepID=UPI0015FEC78C|nr:hypothetical protein [Microbispora sp. H10949]
MFKLLAALVLAGGVVTAVGTAAEVSTSRFGGIDGWGDCPAQAARAVLKRVTLLRYAWGVGDGAAPMCGSATRAPACTPAALAGSERSSRRADREPLAGETFTRRSPGEAIFAP